MSRQERRRSERAAARRRKERRVPRRPSRRLRNLGFLAGIGAAVVVVAVLIVAGVMLRGDGGGSVGPIVVPSPRPADIPRQGNVLGSPDAPVTIVEYTDFQCPFCGRLARDRLPRLETEYLATGKARLILKPVRFLGDESQWAAEAAECAGEQGKYWEYHDILFANQSGENKGAFEKDRLKQFAGELGLDRSSFDVCLDEGRYTGKVASNNDEARRRGVNSTPTVFVGQTELGGLRSYETYKAAIEDELAKQGEAG